MKITHIALCGPVTDGWTYQDNLLPKYHKRLGHDVSLITSKYIYNQDGKLEKDKKNEYVNENDIRVIRLNNKFGTTVNSKFKTYKSLYKNILIEAPDILFVHGVQFIDIKTIIKYKKENPKVKIYVDNHADFSNSATNWFSKTILHKIIWKYFAQQIEPYVEKFYGVLPARVEFLKNIYNIPKEKIELLVMGVDDDKVNNLNGKNESIRKKYGIEEDDFLIVTGGKINDSKRQTLLLMEAVKTINDKIKLIVFGSISNELKERFNSLLNNDKIHYVGWIDPNDTYYYFAASDLVVFPGRHSVFWEQVAGMGIPMLIKYWSGTTHIDVGGNCEFLYEDSVDEIKEKLNFIYNNTNKYNKMKEIAQNKGKQKFLYSNIAKESLK